MLNTKPLLHIVFSPSAGGDLRTALKMMERNEQVVAQFDDFSFGPIGIKNTNRRAKWVESELGYEDWDTVVKGDEVFWEKALSDQFQPIAWFSRRSAKEYSGFLEWTCRSTGVPSKVLDLTQIKTPTGEWVFSLALLPPQQILDLRLLDQAEPLSDVALDQHRNIWRLLQQENAPLRILKNKEFESAPISFFDPLLLKGCTKDWKKAARVIGEALARFYDDDLLQTGDLFLAARLHALVEAGSLESKGDLDHIQSSQVRLPKI
jgi:hypothetical protein